MYTLTPDLAYTIIELVCLSLGASAAFIFDAFFILSTRHHIIRTFEIRMLKRLSLMSIIAGSFALISYMFHLSAIFETATDIRMSVIFSKIIILAVAVLGAIAMRKIHLKTLMRYQEHHAHLSEHMIAHPDSFISTAAYSSVSWMAVIFLTALEYRQADGAFRFGFLAIIISYIAIAFLAGKFAIFIKRRLIAG